MYVISDGTGHVEGINFHYFGSLIDSSSLNISLFRENVKYSNCLRCFLFILETCVNSSNIIHLERT